MNKNSRPDLVHRDTMMQRSIPIPIAKNTSRKPTDAPVNQFVIISMCLLLSGCYTIPQVPTEVRVPYPIPCITRDQLPTPPKLLTNQELLGLPDYVFVLQLGIARTELTQYVMEQRALLEACVKN